ncbi:histidine kinase [Kitasatospora sp. NPDC028055]|uniref:sensor histidine kinase n=1 Tax=Kitasatospora sp. NPDC028055 TaxID=3155653 RepID=UPI0033C76D1C
MIRGIRPLLRGSTYTGALFAYCGALASLVLLPVALAPALAWQSAPYGVRAALALLLWAVLIGAVGLARTTRRVLVASARRLLGVALPDPGPSGAAGASGASGVAATVAADRWRTPLWLLLHVALGWTGALTSGLLLVAGLSLPGDWLGGQAQLSLFGRSVTVSGGGWGRAAGVVCLLLAVAGCAAVAGTLRRLAPRLLGPSAAERLAQAAERERRLAERNRLAHELHDSIGHTLTAATIQAAVAGEVLAADPVTARAAMRSIEESTRAALEDLDYVLGVLREEEAGTAPTRTLADLPELLDRLRHAGAVAEPELTGDLAQVPGTISRAAYRILQEGLTNALRHGAGGPITVRVAAGPDALELRVVNPVGGVAGGAGAGARGFPTSGHGLPGLAERVRLLHGEFEAGPVGGGPDGGGPVGDASWRLAVRLPVRAAV